MTARKKKIRHPGPVRASKQYDHGTHACYVLNHCRCDPCRRARAAYERNRQRWTGEFPRALPPLVDPGPARRHVKALMRQGMGHKRIAEVAGVPASAVGALIWGRYDRAAKKIRRQTAEKLLAVTLDLADGARVPSDEARRIIAELVARGWTKVAIAHRLGNPAAKALQVADGPYVWKGHLVKLKALLEEPVPPRNTRKPVAASTDQRPVIPTVSANGEGKLRCKVCDRPLAFHSVTQRCA